MVLRLAYAITRIVVLCLAAAIGYVAVYMPLLLLLFDKRWGFVILPIIGVALWSAAKCAKFVDRGLPQAYLSVPPSDGPQHPDGNVQPGAGGY